MMFNTLFEGRKNMHLKKFIHVNFFFLTKPPLGCRFATNLSQIELIQPRTRNNGLWNYYSKKICILGMLVITEICGQTSLGSQKQVFFTQLTLNAFNCTINASKKTLVLMNIINGWRIRRTSKNILKA